MTDRAPGQPRGPIRVIFNDVSGSKGGISTNGATKASVDAVLRDVGVDAEILESSSADEARRLTAEAVQRGYAVVVAAGGDGTIGIVATELLNSGTALGVLPRGSIMNIPRMLGIPRDLSAAAAVLACGGSAGSMSERRAAARSSRPDPWG